MLIATAFAAALIPSPALAADTGKLIVKRSAKMGKYMVVNVYVDGKRVGQLQRGSSYTTSLPAGTHQVKVRTSAAMNEPTKQVTIEAGKDTTVTASWDAQQLSLE